MCFVVIVIFLFTNCWKMAKQKTPVENQRNNKTNRQIAHLIDVCDV